MTRKKIRICSVSSAAKVLDLSSLHVRKSLLEIRGVDLVALPALDSLVTKCDCFLLLTRLVQRIRLGREILESLLHLDRLVQPRHSLLVITGVLIVEQIIAGLERRTPVIRLGARDGRFEFAQRGR